MPKNLDKELTGLIKLCWDPDPKHCSNFKTIYEQLLYIKSKKSTLGTNKSGKDDWLFRSFWLICQVNEALTRLLHLIWGYRQNLNSLSYESSSWEKLGQGSQWRVSNDALNSFAKLNNHHKLLSCIKYTNLRKQQFSGQGNNGRVYAATQLGCTVVVKRCNSVLFKSDLVHKLEILITLCHPHKRPTARSINLTTLGTHNHDGALGLQSSRTHQILNAKKKPIFWPSWSRARHQENHIGHGIFALHRCNTSRLEAIKCDGP